MTSILHKHCVMSCLPLQLLKWFKKKENFIGLMPKLSGGEKLDLEKAREANGEW